VSHVAVVGGGISGLLAGLRLQQQGRRVTVLEASARPGGKLRGGHVDGIYIEEGADAFLPRDEAPLELLDELGLDQTESPEVFGAYIWHDDRLKRLPPGSPYGIPRDPSAAHRAGLLSRAGSIRASLERMNRSVLTGPDVSIGHFVRKRFGTEVLTNLVDPLLAGVRGGVADEISLAAGAREIDAIARGNRSVLRAINLHPPVSPRFVRPVGGIGSLTDALAARLDDLRTSAPATRVTIERGKTRVDTPGGAEDYDGVVLACSTSEAAELLPVDLWDVAHDLVRIEYASLAVVTLVYPPGSFAAPEGGSGFLVPSGSGLTIAACTWYSNKWRVTTDGRQVVRCVVGRSGLDPNLTTGDASLVSLVERDLQTTMGITASPVATRVTRWERSIPQYRVGHLELVESIEERLLASGAIVVTGAGYRGSGIPDCIAQADAAAERLGGIVGSGRG
jgi:oxygen-dependent protoporphyrinogen oxidase